MPIKEVLHDVDGNELTCHINTKGDLFLSAGNPDDADMNGFICLKRDDVAHLIQLLQELHDDVNEE